MTFQCAPVLFLTFNRPEQTFRVFQAIRKAKPSQLFIASDGPREDRDNESTVIAAIRERLLSEIDWPCKVHKRFNDTNMGCKDAVSGAISWFFDNVEEGIILEDDCLPCLSFFQFCSDLLAYYRDVPHIMSISGTNLQTQTHYGDGDYYFSLFGDIWGWASWRRAWKLYDADVLEWSEWRKLKKTVHPDARVNARWCESFDRVYDHVVDTWDYQWAFAHISHESLGIISQVNLVQNIGFDAAATHTTAPDSAMMLSVEAREIRFPLVHPSSCEASTEADTYFLPPLSSKSVPFLLKRVITRILRIFQHNKGKN